MGSQKSWVQQILVPKRMFVSQFLVQEQKLGSNKFWVHKNLGSKKFGVQEHFGQETLHLYNEVHYFQVGNKTILEILFPFLCQKIIHSSSIFE